MNNTTNKRKKAIFLDRDGTINKEVNYLFRPQDFQFITGSVDAIKIFHRLGYLVIVITNQAGVAKGYYSENDVNLLHKYIDGLLKNEGTFVDAYYYCPHHPNGNKTKYAIDCNCRKPKTSMIEKAVEKFNIDLGESIIVGDKEIDVLTGKNAGIGLKILVRSGHKINEINTVADMVCDDLISFARILELKSNI